MLAPMVQQVFAQNGILVQDSEQLQHIITLVKDRCTLLPDFVQQAGYFFKAPDAPDIAAVQPKWDDKKNMFFIELMRAYELQQLWQAEELEKTFKEIAAAHHLKPGELLLPLRIMLVGGKFGPGVFEIAGILGKASTLLRIRHTLQLLEH